MGLFRTAVQVLSQNRKLSARISMIVDTGAFISIVPKRTLEKLKVKPVWHRRFTLANGETIERDVGVAFFKWNGEEGASEVITAFRCPHARIYGFESQSSQEAI